MPTWHVGDTARLEYWTGGNATTLAKAAAEGATTITVREEAGYAADDVIAINPGSSATHETATIDSVAVNVLTLTAGLRYPHAQGELVIELADPTTLSLAVTAPDGTETTYTYAGGAITKTATGAYSVDLLLDQAGTWSYVWTGTGTVASAEPGSLYVHST